MERILVERTLDAPIEQVFAILTDHENYERFRAVTKSRLIEQGQPNKNGLGAVREIHAGLPRFVLVEEIRAYESPTRFEYRIIRSRPLPVDHPVGVVELTAVGDQTRVRWESLFHLKVPVVGALLDKLFARAAAKGFRSILRDTERFAQENANREAKAATRQPQAASS